MQSIYTTVLGTKKPYFNKSFQQLIGIPVHFPPAVLSGVFMIMSLSPYSNSPGTACFVSVTSTAKGLSKSTFQKMKREWFADDKPNFSKDKRVRFFTRFCQGCVAFISLNVPVFFFFLMYINLDLAVMGENDDETHFLFWEA
jgi:hypothetical protein